MFWTLLLAHLIADYPLQSSWMVRAKRTLGGLTLHVAIHIVVMLILVGPALPQVWLPLAAIALVHFALDAGKIVVIRWRPHWVVSSYLADQALHMITLWLASAWIAQHTPAATPLLKPNLAILLSGYLLATHIWFISERIFTHRDATYQQELNRFALVRMVTRGLLLTLFLLAGRPASTSTGSALALSLALPYVTGNAQNDQNDQNDQNEKNEKSSTSRGLQTGSAELVRQIFTSALRQPADRR